MTTISNSSIKDSSDRIVELRRKIHDDNYLDFAVQRIAQVLSRRIVEENEAMYARAKENGRA